MHVRSGSMFVWVLVRRPLVFCMRGTQLQRSDKYTSNEVSCECEENKCNWNSTPLIMHFEMPEIAEALLSISPVSHNWWRQLNFYLNSNYTTQSVMLATLINVICDYTYFHTKIYTQPSVLVVMNYKYCMFILVNTWNEMLSVTNIYPLCLRIFVYMYKTNK